MKIKELTIPVDDIKKQLKTVKAFNEKAEMVFNAIHDANDKLAGTIGCLVGEPRSGDTYAGFDINGDGSIYLRYYDRYYDSYCKECVEVPIELFAFTNSKDIISKYWYDLKVKEYEEERERQRKAKAARKKLLAAKAREAKKKIKEKEYETYLKLKKKYEKG